MLADRRLQHIACKSPVAEDGTARSQGKEGSKASYARVIEVIVRCFGHLLENAHQFLIGVVGKLDRGTKATSQPWVLGNEDRHRIGIAGNDQDQVVATVLHLLDQGVDGLLAVL